jgi:hypothetical protein
VCELEAEGSEATKVRHTYDWSNVTDQELLKKISFPLVSESELEAALNNLDQAVTGS